MLLVVKDLQGELTNVKVKPTDTIYALKLKIQDIKKITPEKQRLVIDGQQLLTGNTLEDYNLKENQIIHLIPRASESFQVEIKTLTGKRIPKPQV